jgi:peptidoglycan/LPS O-acetylase OafA/YrhL
VTIAPTPALDRTQVGTAAPPSEPLEHAGYLATRTFGSLDGLRALSILAVLWHHTDRKPGGLALLDRGFLGVDLFFVLSGFLIVTLLLRERRRTGDVSLRAFYIRRFLRIFPPYYLMLALVAATAWLKPGHGSAGLLADLPFALLYVSNLVPMHSLLSITWSLSTEEQFYVVVPALERYAPRAVAWLLPIGYVLVSLPPFGWWPALELPSFFRQTTFGPILLGVMLAHALHSPAGYAAIARIAGHRAAPVVAAGLLALASSHPAADISGWPRLLIHWAMAALVATCVVRERHLLARVLSLWPLRRIGIVSYGIYLYHMLVWYFVNRAMERLGLASQPLFFAANTLGSWALAELSYHGFESKVLALKARFAA